MDIDWTVVYNFLNKKISIVCNYRHGMQEYGRLFIVVHIYDGGWGLLILCLVIARILTLRKKSICDMCDENYFQGIFFA